MQGKMTVSNNALRHDFKLQKNPGYKSGNFIRWEILSDYHLHESGGVLNG